jgi:preprotein translocase subunit SecD
MRSWWLQAVVYAFLTAAAVVVLLPSVLGFDQLPDFLRAHARQMKPSVEVQGGLSLGYEVDVDDVVLARLRLLGSEIERSMREDHGAVGVTAVPRGDGALAVRFDRTSDHRRLAASLATDFDLEEAERSQEQGLVVLRLAPAQVDQLMEKTVQSALGKVRSLVDGGCNWGTVITRERNRILIELPGIRTAEAPRIRSLIERL